LLGLNTKWEIEVKPEKKGRVLFKRTMEGKSRECTGENLAEGNMDLGWAGGPYIQHVPLCCGTTM